MLFAWSGFGLGCWFWSSLLVYAVVCWSAVVLDCVLVCVLVWILVWSLCSNSFREWSFSNNGGGGVGGFGWGDKKIQTPLGGDQLNIWTPLRWGGPKNVPIWGKKSSMHHNTQYIYILHSSSGLAGKNFIWTPPPLLKNDQSLISAPSPSVSGMLVSFQSQACQQNDSLWQTPFWKGVGQFMDSPSRVENFLIRFEMLDPGGKSRESNHKRESGMAGLSQHFKGFH